MQVTFSSAFVTFTLFGPVATVAIADPPTDLVRGEAPLLFTGAEGEDADGTLLADGVSTIRGDEIWLWVPALDKAGMVDLAATGQFFRVWDSGPEAGPNGNDDDDNGMRGMDFDASTGTFLLSYEDTTTTGFDLGPIADGALLRLTPTTVTGGFVSAFDLAFVYDECANGSPGCIGTGDINALCLAPDGSIYFGAGGAQTIMTDDAGSPTLEVTSSTLVHANGIDGDSPINLGPDRFFEGTTNGCGVIFCPHMFVGQIRGSDVLADGLLTFGTSGEWRNTDFLGPIDGLTDAQAEALAVGLTSPIGRKADICSLPNHGNLSLNTYQRRTAEVLYNGSLFFLTPNVGDAEMLDHDILDTPSEVSALIATLGADSDAGIALTAHLGKMPCPADLDRSGAVDFGDLVSVLGSWGPCPGCPADLNSNGSVGFDDLVTLLSAWGLCPS